jgi:DNA-3-methyladenine glycosylase
MRPGRILKPSFYERPVKQVARDLLGKMLWRKTSQGVLSGIIVETESYGGTDDPASHAYRKRTLRNSVMFGLPGRAYVYFCYGNHYLFNVVAEKENVPAAVLIRALEPVEGVPLMRKERRVKKDKDLCNGPGKLTQALLIDKRFNTMSLSSGGLVIRETGMRKFRVKQARRIGITWGAEKLLRFYVKGSPFVSKA